MAITNTSQNTVSVRSHMRLFGDLSFDTERGSFPDNPSTNQMSLVDGILYIFSKVNGVRTWYPLTHKKTSHVHTQAVPSSTWTVTHNQDTADYGFFVYDENGSLQYADTEYVDNNTVKILLSTPTSGKAVMFFDYEITAKTLSTDTLETTNIEGMFSKVGNNIMFDGNLIPTNPNTWSIGSTDNPIKEMFVSANTIHLGSSVLAGTNITINEDESSTQLSQQPTFVASKIVAKPYQYNPGTGTITVRPSIEFQDESGISNPISFNSATGEFSLDRGGNHGEGSLIGKVIKSDSIESGSAILSDNLRVDGNVNLGYDSSNIVTVRGVLDLDTAVTFTENATLGDGNDDIKVNCGTANIFEVISQHFSLDNAGNLSLTGNLNVQGTLNATTQNSSSTTDSTITDNYFISNGAGINNSGLKVDRSSETTAIIHFNEVNNLWECGLEGSEETIVLDNDSRLLTTDEIDDLTGGSDSVSHFHSDDRNRSNHTGTQLSSTISDFDVAAINSVQSALDDKVSVVAGKGLSTNDFTNTDKQTLDNLSTGTTIEWTDILNKPNIAYEFGIPADDLTQLHVDNIRSGKLANGDNPIPTLERPPIVTVTDETITSYNFTYEPSFLMVFLNRQLLRPSEYTSTDGTTISFNIPLSVDDEIEITTATK